jgi:hypothetical protein
MNNISKNIENALDANFVYTKENDRRKNGDRRKANSDRRTLDSSNYAGAPQRLIIDRRSTTRDRRQDNDQGQ